MFSLADVNFRNGVREGWKDLQKPGWGCAHWLPWQEAAAALPQVVTDGRTRCGCSSDFDGRWGDAYLATGPILRPAMSPLFVVSTRLPLCPGYTPSTVRMHSLLR